MSEQLSYEATGRTLTTAAGGTLHYHEAGSGEPLILLHGSGPGVFGWANFSRNLALFAQHFRTIIIDLPGYGGSTPVAGFPVDTGVAATLELMDKFGFERARIVGNSMGGMIGTNFAAKYPQRIDRLCTIGGAGMNIYSPFPSEGVNLLVDFTEAPSRERLIAWLRSMVFDQSLITEELIEDRWRRATDPATLEVSRRMYSRAAIQAIAAGMRSNPPGSHLPSIQCPTLITWGRDDRVSPLDWSILPMRMIPKCELHVFYDCGHWAMIERQYEFENVVLAFMQRKY